MILTEFQGSPAYLCPYPPEARKSVALSLRLFTEIVDSLGGAEARRSFSRTVRVDLQCRLTLLEDEARDFRAALRVLENKKVLLPFWPAEQNYAAADSHFRTGLWLVAEPDFSAWEISSSPLASGFVPSAQATRVPLLIGYFADAPNPVALTGDAFEVDIKFREASPASYALRAHLTPPFTAGPTLAAHTPYLFPLAADWSKPPVAGKAEVRIERAALGFGRLPLEVYYPQRSAREFTTHLAMNSAEFATLLRFFLDRRGPVEGFWLPGVYSELALLAPTSADSATVHCEGAEHVAAGDYLLFSTGEAVPVMRKVIGRDLAQGTVELSAAPGAFQPGRVQIAALILARFKRDELSVEFDAGNFEAKVDFVETPDEYDPPASEQVGVTIGAQPTKAFLYRFSQYFPDSTLVNRFTSHEQAIIVDGQTFSAAHGLFEHGEINDSLEGEQSSVKLSSRAFAGNPLMLFHPFRLEVPLWLEILECEPEASGVAASARCLWHGRCTRPTFTGPRIKFESVHRLQSLNSQVPGPLVGPTCSKEFCGPYCGVSEADWTFSGTVISYHALTATLTVTQLTRLGQAAAALAAGYFSFGRVYGGAGANYFSRTIGGSSAYGGEAITLSLSPALTVVPAPGSVVKIFPNCQRTPSACEAFGNFNRCGAHPFVPNGNPSFVPVKKTTGGGKK